MKLKLITFAGLLVATQVAASAELKTTDQKASYTLGSDLAKNFKDQGMEIDVKAFSQGLEDALNNRPSKLSEKEMMEAIKELRSRMMEKQMQAMKAQADANLKAGEKYMAENAKKPGIKTMKNGIQYKVINSGKGNSPQDGDTIFAHYEGKLIDGTVFDSSFKRGTPLKFQAANVIPGWGAVLKIMKPGDKWEVTIPSSLAYGAKGAGDRIGPNETLIFTIELIQFSKGE